MACRLLQLWEFGSPLFPQSSEEPPDAGPCSGTDADGGQVDVTAVGAPEALATGGVLLVVFVRGRAVVAEPGCV